MSLLTQPHITCTDDAIRIAHQLASRQDQEWLCALYLDAKHDVIDYHLYHLEHFCPIGIDVQTLYEDARVGGPKYLLTVRSHPHPGQVPLAELLDWVEALQVVCLDVGIPLQDHISGYSDGHVFSFRDRARAIREAGLPSWIRSGPYARLIAALIS